MDKEKSALVVGAGDSLGKALAHCLVRHGFETCLARRDQAKLDTMCQDIGGQTGHVHGFALNATVEQQVVTVFSQIEENIAPIELLVFNIGSAFKSSILSMTSGQFEKIWKEVCFAGFLAAREAAKYMVGRGRGTIIFSGATASITSAQGYSAFSAAKMGLRAVSHSMARELGPQGVHVAHVIVDGVIDSPFMRQSLSHSKANDLLLMNPNAIAENYYMLYQQPRNAWTHELDLRTCSSPW